VSGGGIKKRLSHVDHCNLKGPCIFTCNTDCSLFPGCDPKLYSFQRQLSEDRYLLRPVEVRRSRAKRSIRCGLILQWVNIYNSHL